MYDSKKVVIYTFKYIYIYICIYKISILFPTESTYVHMLGGGKLININVLNWNIILACTNQL